VWEEIHQIIRRQCRSRIVFYRSRNYTL
jgi:hypothetical protein